MSRDGTVNEFTPPNRPAGGAVNMVHGACQWQLEPDQALIVEFDQPDATYWSIQTYMLNWLQPFDFANRVTSLNDGQIHADEDGRVRVVIAHSDPGVQNWLDTTGLPEGLCSYRWVRATTEPTPTTRVVAIDEVRARLPRSTPAFTHHDRTAQIVARRRGVARRFRR